MPSAAPAISASRRRAPASIAKPNRRGAAADQQRPHCSRPPSATAAATPLAPNRRPSGSAATSATPSADQRGAQRRRGVFAGEERRRQRLHQHLRRQAERQQRQRLRGRRGVGGAERAVLEQQLHDRLAQHDQPERRRQRQRRAPVPALRGGSAPAPPRSSPRTARDNSGTSTAPIATPTMPSGSSISRLAKYSHDTAEGCDDATIAPATISNCGPELAIMPGTAWRGTRASARRTTRAAASRAARRGASQHRQLQQPGDADGRGEQQRRLGLASRRQINSATVTPISAQVEQQRRERGQRDVALRVEQPHHHRDRAGEGEIGQHQPGIVDRELQRRLSDEARRQRARSAAASSRPSSSASTSVASADGAEHPPGEGRGGGRAVALAHPQPGRHQRGVQRAFGQQPPRHIDQLERQQERVRDRRRRRAAPRPARRERIRAAATPACRRRR